MTNSRDGAPADDTPSREQVVLFEPRADMPVADQHPFYDLLASSRRQLVNPVLWLMVIGGVVVLLLPGFPFGITLPAVVVLAGVANLTVQLRRAQFLSRTEFATLTEARPRQVTLGEGDLLRVGRTFAVRLPEKWLVTRLSSADAMALSRFRRVWVFGPSPGGWIGLMVTGGGAPRLARLAGAPPAGAEPVPAPAPRAEWPTPPKDDPAVRFAVDARIRASLYAVTMFAVVIGLVTLDRFVSDGVGSVVADVWWWFVSALLALLAVVTLGEIGRTRRAGRSTRWAWTRVEAEEPDVVNVSQLTMRVRVDVPGSELYLKVSGPPALVLSVHESKGLWLIGDLNPRRPMIVGIPELPAVGRARAVRPPR